MNNIYKFLIDKLRNNRDITQDIKENFNKNSSEYLLMQCSEFLEGNRKYFSKGCDPISLLKKMINNKISIQNYILNLINSYFSLEIKNDSYEIIGVALYYLMKKNNSFSWEIVMLTFLAVINSENINNLSNEYKYIWSQRRHDGTFGFSNPFQLKNNYSDKYLKNEFHVDYMRDILKNIDDQFS